MEISPDQRRTSLVGSGQGGHRGGAHGIPGMTMEQFHGERLSNDPDWSGGCWLPAYLRLHHLLVRRAKDINRERLSDREDREAARGEEAPTAAYSIRLLRKQVFALSPLWYIYTGICFSVVLTTLSFLAPAVSGQIVDIAVWLHHHPEESQNIWPTLMPHLLQYGYLLIGSYICEILVGILFAIAGHTTVTRLRIKLFRNLVSQDIAFYDKHISGELSSRLINDSAALSNLTQFTTQTLLGALVKFFGSLISMYYTHPYLALLATFITPVSMVLVKFTGNTVGFYGVVQNDAMAKTNAVSVEVLGSIRTVQSNVGEAMEGERFMERMNYFLRVIKATVYVETVLRFTSNGLGKLRNVLVLAVGMYEVSAGSLSIGAYTAFFQYVQLYDDGFTNLTEIFLNIKQTITSTGKFVQLLLRDPAIPPDEGEDLQQVRGEVEFRDVVFAYESHPERDVLRRINLKAVPGTSIALVGESGAGKSTIGRLLQRYYDPKVGSILIDGRDYRGLNLRSLRSHIGVVEQEPVLFDRPMRDNIAYGSASNRGEGDIERATRLANAHGFITDLPEGYATQAGERACRLSGGQKQRVAIARAVIRDPRVLLLDEATSALDAENEHFVQEALEQLMRGRTTFIIAHRLSTVKGATKILVLDQGIIVEEGSHDELAGRDGKYATFMRYQMVKVNPLLE